jgi:hypothetical protein
MLVRRRPLPADRTLVERHHPALPSDADPLAEALSIIDYGLVAMTYRQLMTADEVSDLLLDLRVSLLVAELEAVGPASGAAS